MPYNHNLGKDDFSFNFKFIQDGYAAIGYLVSARAGMESAVKVYNRQANGNEDPHFGEYTDKSIRKAVSALRHASRYWQSEPTSSLNLSGDYSRYLSSASQDCIKPLAVLTVMEQALERANTAALSGEPMHVARQVSQEELRKAFNTIRRARLFIERFQQSLEKYARIGVMEVRREDAEVNRFALARAVTPKPHNPHFDKEVIFMTIIGLIAAEQEMIAQAKANDVAYEYSERDIEVLDGIAATLGNYAKGIIANPAEAIRNLQPDIARSIEAIQGILTHAQNEDNRAFLQVLEYNINQLRQTERSEGRL